MQPSRARSRCRHRSAPEHSSATATWTSSLEAVERLDRLRFPSDISFRSRRAGARRRRAARERVNPARATRAASGDFALDGAAKPADARAERRRSPALFAGRRPACLHLRPRSQGQGRSVHPRRGRGEAARRHSGDDRGFALDRDGAAHRRARRRSRPRRRRNQRREAPHLGRGGRSRRSTTRRRARGGSSRSMRRRRDRSRSAPPISASGSSTCSATDAAVALVSDDPSERGWYHTRAGQARFRHAADDDPASLALAAAVALPSRLRASASPSSKAGRAIAAWSRARSRFSISRPASWRRVAAAEAADVTTLRLASTRRASGSPAGRSSARSTASSDRREGRLVALRRRDHRHQQLLRAGSRRAPDKTGFAAVREAVGEPPEIVFKASTERAWKPVTQLNGRSRSGLSTTIPKSARFAGRARTVWSSKASCSCPAIADAGPLPTIVDIHGGPSWAAKYAFNPGYALPLAAAGYAVFLPNYRGNTGWGQNFAKLNIGDPAAPSSRISSPASIAASPRALPIPTGSASPARATAAI